MKTVIFILAFLTTTGLQADALQNFCSVRAPASYAMTRSTILAKLKPKGADCLGQARALSELSFVRLRGQSIEDLGPMEVFRSATRMDLSRNAIKDLSPLLALAKLAVVDLSRNEISDLSPAQANGSIEEINLDHQKGRKISFNGLPNLKVLRALSIQEAGLTSLGGLGSLPPQLQKLDIYWNDIKDAKVLEKYLKTVKVKFAPTQYLCGEADRQVLDAIHNICAQSKS